MRSQWTLLMLLFCAEAFGQTSYAHRSETEIVAPAGITFSVTRGSGDRAIFKKRSDCHEDIEVRGGAGHLRAAPGISHREAKSAKRYLPA
jgi:hypothetical protein